MKYAILDIDNTISDDGWRIHRIDWRNPDLFERYHAYHLAAELDECGNRHLFERAEDAHILLLTSAPVNYRTQREGWLAKNRVPYLHLLMRNTCDFRPSVALKRWHVEQLYAHYGVEHGEIVAAYDDRQEIVDMYRSLGIPAERRWLHAVDAFTNPITGQNHASGEQKVA